MAIKAEFHLINFPKGKSRARVSFADVCVCMSEFNHFTSFDLRRISIELFR